MLANLLLGRKDLPRVIETRKLWEEKDATVLDDAEEEDGVEPVTLSECAEEGEEC